MLKETRTKTKETAAAIAAALAVAAMSSQAQAEEIKAGVNVGIVNQDLRPTGFSRTDKLSVESSGFVALPL